MSDLENCKRMFDNAHIPYFAEPSHTHPGYSFVGTARLTFTFDSKGTLVEMVQKDTTE